MILDKKDFINEMANRCQITKVEAREQYEAVFGVLIDLLSKNNTVLITGLGKFEIKERQERKGRNPATGENILIPSKKVLSFKVSKTLKDIINSL